jgi:hypothetical protein
VNGGRVAAAAPSPSAGIPGDHEVAPPSESLPAPGAATSAHDHPLTGPLLVWLALQLLALLIPLLRVPLAAGYPRPAELLAAHVMVVTQVTASALLFPWLLRNRASAIAAVATTWPFAALAGAVSGLPPMRALSAGSYVTAWMVAWWAWPEFAPARARGAAVAAASLLAAGSLALFYLWLEFGPDAGADVGEAAALWAPLSPPLAALRLLQGAPGAREYSVPAAVAVGALACRFFTRRRRQVIHRS